MKLTKSPTGRDDVLGFVVSGTPRDKLTVETSRGATQTISTVKYAVSGRGGTGRQLLKRGQFLRVVPAAVVVSSLGDDSD